MKNKAVQALHKEEDHTYTCEYKNRKVQLVQLVQEQDKQNNTIFSNANTTRINDISDASHLTTARHQNQCQKNKTKSRLHQLQKTSLPFKERFRNKYNKFSKIGQICKIANSVSVTPRSNSILKKPIINTHTLLHNKMRLKTAIQKQSCENIQFRRRHHKIATEEGQRFKSLQTSKVQKNKIYFINKNDKNKEKSDCFSIKQQDNQQTVTKVIQRRTLTPTSKYANFKKKLYNCHDHIQKSKSKAQAYSFFDQDQPEFRHQHLQDQQCQEVSENNIKRDHSKADQTNQQSSAYPLCFKLKEKSIQSNPKCRQDFSKNMKKRLQTYRKSKKQNNVVLPRIKVMKKQNKGDEKGRTKSLR